MVYVPAVDMPEGWQPPPAQEVPQSPGMSPARSEIWVSEDEDARHEGAIEFQPPNAVQEAEGEDEGDVEEEDDPEMPPRLVMRAGAIGAARRVQPESSPSSAAGSSVMEWARLGPHSQRRFSDELSDIDELAAPPPSSSSSSSSTALTQEVMETFTYVNAADMDGMLECHICTSVPLDAVVVHVESVGAEVKACGRLYCKPCVDQNQESVRRGKCCLQYCKVPINAMTLRPVDMIVAKMLRNLQVKCTVCDQVMPRSQAVSHKGSAKCRVTCALCKVAHGWNEKEKHKGECMEETVPCGSHVFSSTCKWTGKRRVLHMHMTNNCIMRQAMPAMQSMKRKMDEKEEEIVQLKRARELEPALTPLRRRIAWQLSLTEGSTVSFYHDVAPNQQWVEAVVSEMQRGNTFIKVRRVMPRGPNGECMNHTTPSIRLDRVSHKLDPPGTHTYGPFNPLRLRVGDYADARHTDIRITWPHTAAYELVRIDAISDRDGHPGYSVSLHMKTAVARAATSALSSSSTAISAVHNASAWVPAGRLEKPGVKSFPLALQRMIPGDPVSVYLKQHNQGVWTEGEYRSQCDAQHYRVHLKQQEALAWYDMPHLCLRVGAHHMSFPGPHPSKVLH